MIQLAIGHDKSTVIEYLTVKLIRIIYHCQVRYVRPT